MAADLPALYRDGQQRVTELVRELTDADLATPVPATPAWTVQDVVAHLTGIVTDVRAGNITLGEPAWTQAQVDTRRGRPLADVLDEWASGTQHLLAAPPDQPVVLAALVSDVTQHEHDMRAAVGRPGARDTEAVALARKGYAILLASKIAAAGLPALELVAGDWVFTPRTPDIAGQVRADGYELLRSLGGRRSAAQVRAYDWDVDPEPYLPLWSAYGELRESDLAE